MRQIAVTPYDTPKRQRLTVVHELLHNFAHPVRPPHRDLHTLAAGLAYNIFPRLYAQEASYDMDSYDLFDEDELAVLTDDDLDFDDDDEYDYEYDDDDDYDDEALDFDDDVVTLSDLGDDVYGDEDDYDLFRRRRGWRSKLRRLRKKMHAITPHGMVMNLIKKKKKRRKRKKAARRAAAAAVVKVAKNKVMPMQKPAGAAGLSTQLAWGGWAMPHIKNMFQGNTLTLPRKGITRMTPIHNINGYKASTWPAFWAQLIQSLDAGANRTTKEVVKNTVIAATPTNPAFATARSIGMIVRFSDSITNGVNEPLRVNHFTGAGQTPLDINVDVELDKGTAEYIVLHVENDRGSGVPTALPLLELTVAADDLRAGSRVQIESINLRDLQA